MNTRPPESSKNGIDFTYEGLGEENSRHVVHWNRSKERFDVGEPPSMVELVGLHSC